MLLMIFENGSNGVKNLIEKNFTKPCEMVGFLCSTGFSDLKISDMHIENKTITCEVGNKMILIQR